MDKSYYRLVLLIALRLKKGCVPSQPFFVVSPKTNTMSIKSCYIYYTPFPKKCNNF